MILPFQRITFILNTPNVNLHKQPISAHFYCVVLRFWYLLLSFNYGDVNYFHLKTAMMLKYYSQIYRNEDWWSKNYPIEVLLNVLTRSCLEPKHIWNVAYQMKNLHIYKFSCVYLKWSRTGCSCLFLCKAIYKHAFSHMELCVFSTSFSHK
jgi:hypothetical protein